MPDSIRDLFETLAKVLLRCSIFGFALLLFSFVLYSVAGGVIDEIHGRVFGLSPHEVDLIFYCWLGALKLLVLVFFLMPWVAIKLVPRKAKG